MPSLRSQIVQRIMKDFKDALLYNIPIEERRRRFEAAARSGIRAPRGVTAREIRPGGVCSDWLEPVDPAPGRVLLYLHGGAYVICSPATHRGLAGGIAKAGDIPTLVIDYRLAPENPFPAALDDALTTYHWLLEQGYPPTHIAIGGDSAGGGLTLATTLALRDRGEPLPAALFLISPWTDLTFSGESIKKRADRDPVLKLNDEGWLVETYANGNPLTHPYISPLFADLHGLPPTLIHVGTEEILYDDSARLEKKLKSAGVKTEFQAWPGMWHVFQAFAPYVPEAQQAVDQTGAFLKRYVPSGRAS
jgi:epsilon-lactone hydrolase